MNPGMLELRNRRENIPSASVFRDPVIVALASSSLARLNAGRRLDVEVGQHEQEVTAEKGTAEC